MSRMIYYYLGGLAMLPIIAPVDLSPSLATSGQPAEVSGLAVPASVPTPAEVSLLSYRCFGSVALLADGTLLVGIEGEVGQETPEDGAPVETYGFEINPQGLTLEQGHGLAILDVDGAFLAALGIDHSDMSSVPLDGTFRSATASECARTSVLELNGELVMDLAENGDGYIELTDSAQGTIFAVTLASSPADGGGFFRWDHCAVACSLGSCSVDCLMPIRHSDCWCDLTGHPHCICRPNFGFGFDVVGAAYLQDSIDGANTEESGDTEESDAP